MFHGCRLHGLFGSRPVTFWIKLGDRQVVEVGQELKTDFKSKCVLLPIVSAETDLRSGFASRTSSRGDAMVR